MNGNKIEKFMQLGGQHVAEKFEAGDEKRQKLGAQLLLSEVLEYVIKGLGVTPLVDGTPIKDPNALSYETSTAEIDGVEALDGLADVAYTMYWNMHAFGLPLEEAFDRVCDNNLEKFVALKDWGGEVGELDKQDWHCNCDTSWPEEVESVEVLKIGTEFFAVGKDKTGKVRKPSHYISVELSDLIS